MNYRKRYRRRLEDYKRKNCCGIIESRTKEDLGWPLTGLRAPDKNFIRTRHHFKQGFDKGKDMDVYHYLC